MYLLESQQEMIHHKPELCVSSSLTLHVLKKVLLVVASSNSVERKAKLGSPHQTYSIRTNLLHTVSWEKSGFGVSNTPN